MPTFTWGHSAYAITFEFDEGSPLRVRGITLGDKNVELPAGPPFVELLTVEDGRERSSTRMVYTALGARLRYVDHATTDNGAWSELRMRLEDPGSGMRVQAILEGHQGIAAIRSRLVVAAERPRTLLAAPSWSSSLVFDEDFLPEEFHLLTGESDWLAEGRWTETRVRNRLLPHLGLEAHGQDARGEISGVSKGSWSTGKDLPTAVLSRPDGGSVAWQVEHNGGWRWELGEDQRAFYLSLGGPTDVDHGWSTSLESGDEFETVPVSVAFGSARSAAIDELTKFRRASRRVHLDSDSAPVIFNDYMNTLMGDPTTEKLLPLIDSAAAVGAEVFCIDAGWYDDDPDWWDGVGEWIPSARRFPGGLTEVVDRIRSKGMVPGLWLEPEVVGVRSPAAAGLPDQAFFERNGRRLTEHGRHHLDFSNATARSHLDAAVDRLVSEFGVGYFKLDYNIDAGAGTDGAGGSAGSGLLEHNRAYLAWIDGLLDRYPGLILENCSSGAMRMDFALLSRMQLQSTTDQQDASLYPPIAASAPMSMLPEQAANWAYPQPSMTESEIVFCLCLSMLGRFYLSGHLDQMTDAQKDLIAGALAAHKGIRAEIARATPFWPIGLPTWHEQWTALGLTADSGSSLISVWKRSASTGRISLDLPGLSGLEVEVAPIFPASLEHWDWSWDTNESKLELRSLSTDIDATTFRVRSRRHRAQILDESTTLVVDEHQENKEQFQ